MQWKRFIRVNPIPNTQYPACNCELILIDVDSSADDKNAISFTAILILSRQSAISVHTSSLLAFFKKFYESWFYLNIRLLIPWNCLLWVVYCLLFRVCLNKLPIVVMFSALNWCELLLLKWTERVSACYIDEPPCCFKPYYWPAK